MCKSLLVFGEDQSHFFYPQHHLQLSSFLCYEGVTAVMSEQKAIAFFLCRGPAMFPIGQCMKDVIGCALGVCWKGLRHKFLQKSKEWEI